MQRPCLTQAEPRPPSPKKDLENGAPDVRSWYCVDPARSAAEHGRADVEEHDVADPGCTQAEVLAKYMEYMTPALLSRACHPVIYGRAAANTLDRMNADGMEHWTTGAGMRYRSRRDVLEISSNPAFAGSHEYKIAAMAKTIAFPIDPWLQLGDPRLVLALVFGVIGCGLSWREAARSRKISAS